VALRPACQGTNVKPSGLFPSSLLRPCGSLTAGISALIIIIIIIINNYYNIVLFSVSLDFDIVFEHLL